MRLSHHRHSGRLRPHGETSYALLMFLVLITSIVSLLVTSPTYAAMPTNESGKSESYKVEAVVTGPRPTQPVIIRQPTAGQTFTANPVDVSGTCPARTLVKIFKNGVLAGSVLCEANGTFKLPIDLLIGANALTAAAYNTNDLSGPESPAVNVTLNMPTGGFGFSTELVLQSTSYYRGTIPGQAVNWPVEIVGGVGPYALNFDWGDKKSDLITRLQAGGFNLAHTYTEPGGYLGSYPLIIRATDSVGHTAYLQLVTIVNDPKGTGVGTSGSGSGSGSVTAVQGGIKFITSVLVVWPIIIILILMIIAFWLGERREKHVLEKRMAALA